MGKIIIGIIAVFIFFFIGIDTLRSLSGKEKIDLTKMVGYSILCSLLTITAVATIVLLF